MAREKLLQLQLALFFEKVENRPDKLMDKIDEVLDGVFDKMPTILPIPPDAPPEIPNVIMQSSDGKYNCNIARSRIDFTVNYSNSGGSASVHLDEFMEKIRPFAALIFGYKNITRFGFVGQYFFKENKPQQKIQSKFFKKDLGDVDELNIRYNNRFQSKGIVVNDIIELGQANIQDAYKAQQHGIFVQRDMNNVPVDSLKIEDVISIISEKKENFKLSGIMRLVQ